MDHFFGKLRHHHTFIPKQRAQIAILIMLFSTIVTNGRDFIKLDVLASLWLIKRVKEYASGSLGLACAYPYFSNIS